jgi:DNA-binding CsgD family transcriptional regulator
VSASVEVVGRQFELAELAAFLVRARQGVAVVVLRGPAGIGKTTLWRAGTAMAEERGWRALSARPSEAEATMSFSGLVDLIGDAADEVLPNLAPLQRRALEVVLLRQEAGERRVDSRAVGTALLSALRELATRGPLLLAVDDWQWLDQATASTLGYAVRRLEGQEVGLLASVRTGDQWPDKASGRPVHRALTILDALCAESHGATTLAPLSTEHTEELLRRKFPGRLSPAAAAKAATASDGNAFFAVEIARELLRLGHTAASGTLPVPRQLQDLLEAELERMPATTREALLAAACLAQPDRDQVDAVALGEAEDAGLVEVENDGRVRFTHPLFRAAVYGSAQDHQRRTVHRALALRVTDPEERARHLALGAEGPDEDVAAQLDEAAHLAHGRGSPGAAAELVDLAVQLAPSEGGERRAERLLKAASFHFEAGELTAAHERLSEVIRTCPGSGAQASALRLLAQLSARSGSFGEAVRLASQALSAASDQPALSVAIQLDLVFFLTSLGDFAGALPHADAGLQQAQSLGLDPLEAASLATRTVIRFLLGQGLSSDDLERALRLEDPGYPGPIIFRPRAISGLLLLWNGRAREGFDVLDELRADAVEQGRETEAPLLYLYLTWACVWKGDIAGALAVADEAFRRASHLDDRIISSLAYTCSAIARAFAGDVPRARSDVAQAVALFERLQWGTATVWTSWALGLLELSLGNAANVEAVLSPASAALGDLSNADPVLAMFLPDEVEALIQLGQLEKAERLLDNFERRAADLSRGWALVLAGRCRGLLLAAHGSNEAALEAYEGSLRKHETLELPLERGRTLLELGRLHRRCKHRNLARDNLDQALAIFVSSGAVLWAEKARSERARAVGTPSSSGLTATEESIARFAADGLSNQAIAQRCYVTIKTVEANLTRAYRKLGVRSRSQLAKALDNAAP